MYIQRTWRQLIPSLIFQLFFKIFFLNLCDNFNWSIMKVVRKRNRKKRFSMSSQNVLSLKTNFVQQSKTAIHSLLLPSPSEPRQGSNNEERLSEEAISGRHWAPCLTGYTSPALSGLLAWKKRNTTKGLRNNWERYSFYWDNFLNFLTLPFCGENGGENKSGCRGATARIAPNLHKEKGRKESLSIVQSKETFASDLCSCFLTHIPKHFVNIYSHAAQHQPIQTETDSKAKI